MSRKRILFLTTRYPYPPIGGDKVKAYNLLKILTKYYDVKLIAWSFGKLPEVKDIEVLQSLGIEVEVLKFNPVIGALNSFIKLLSKLPFEISFYNLASYQKSVLRNLSAGKYDAVVAFFMRAGEFVKDMKIKKILVAEDCRTSYQRRSFEQTSKFFQKLIRFHEWKKLQKYEFEMMECFDTVSFVTTQDIALIKKINPNGHYRLLTNGTDIERFIPGSYREPNTLLFAGKMNVHSNQISALELAKDILPKVAEKNPEIRLIIAGADMNTEIRGLASDRIEILENVEDMVHLYQKATIFINPHRGGSGIQNKLLEAMACECAVITTLTGNQGIDGIDNQDLVIADSVDDFADKIVKLLKYKEAQSRIGKAGRELILRTHTWDVVEQQLLSIMKRTLDE